MRDPIFSLLQPLIVSVQQLSLDSGACIASWAYPWHTTAHRFFPLMLAHIPPDPSISASHRALIVFSDPSSCLLQCGTSPHRIVCMNIGSGLLSRFSPANSPRALALSPSSGSWVLSPLARQVEDPDRPTELPEEVLPSSSRRRMTGACERGATLYLNPRVAQTQISICRLRWTDLGTNWSWPTHSPIWMLYPCICWISSCCLVIRRLSKVSKVKYKSNGSWESNFDLTGSPRANRPHIVTCVSVDALRV